MKEQTWKVALDMDAGRVDFITRADDVVRQSFHIADVHDKHRDRILLRGLKVTLEERTSQVSGGNIQKKMDARQEVADLLATEEWTKERVGGGFTVAIHFDAIARLTGRTVQDARESFKALSEEKQKALLASEKVKAMIAEIEAESADVDLTDLEDLI